jgi:hypothetical protein
VSWVTSAVAMALLGDEGFAIFLQTVGKCFAESHRAAWPSSSQFLIGFSLVI